MSEENQDTEVGENDIDTKESLNTAVYAMIRLCLNLEKAIRLKEGKEKVLNVLGGMETIQNHLGAIAFSECDIQEEDCRAFFVENDTEIIDKLKINDKEEKDA